MEQLTSTTLANGSRFASIAFNAAPNPSKGSITLTENAIIFDALSNQVAEAMASGALKNSEAGLAVSITGIAGPNGGSKEKPVGKVFFGYALKGGSVGSLEQQFKGNREEIQAKATVKAIKHLIAVLGK